MCHLAVPPGYKVGKLTPIFRETAFGTASWTATALPKADVTEVTVTLKVVVSRFSATQAGYAALKQFLAAIQEVRTQAVVMERVL